MILFRLLSAQPQTDGESWKISGQVHQDQWYEDAYGQNPVPFQQPSRGPQRTLPYPWQPYAEFTGTGDALPHVASFAVGVDTSAYPATISISGNSPVNLPNGKQPPILPLQGSTSNTGGGIPPGTYLLALTLDSPTGPVSNLFSTVVVPSGTSTNTITLSGVQWPNDGTYHSSAHLFIGTSVLGMRDALSGTGGVGFWTGSSPDANGNPQTITLTGFPYSGRGLPDNCFHEYQVEESAIAHGGIWGDSVTSVAGAVLTFAGSGSAWTVNHWAGRILSLYYRPGVTPQPMLNLTVSSNTSGTLTMSAAGFIPGDIVVMRMAAGSITSTTVGDADFINNYSPSGLDVSGQENGRLIVILSGTGAGQPPKAILSNTSTVFTIAQPWDIIPDATSVWITISPTIAYSYSTQTIVNDGTGTAYVNQVAQVPAMTTQAQSLLIRVATSDDAGNAWPMRYQPFREVYIPPQFASHSEGAVYTVPNVANVFIPDLSQGVNQRVLLVADSTIKPPVNGPLGASITWTLIIDQDSTGGHNAVFDPLYFYTANLLGTSAVSTRAQSDWILDQAGRNSLSGVPSTDQPIPA